MESIIDNLWAIKMNWKYIIFETPYVYRMPILFPPVIEHNAMARKFEGRKPVSAGFVTMGIDAVPHCFGKSISLALEAQDEDVACLKHLIG